MPRLAVVLTAAVAAMLSSAAPTYAQYFGRNKVHYDRLDFRVLRTEHFDIHYYDDEAEATRHAARMAERWYARFSGLLGHTFNQRQVLVLYESHPHFAQTNLTAGSPGEGVGGFTERAKSRIAMPFAAGLGETDHVLGHEIAHAFQIDVARRAKQDAFALPGWFIEGMAEFLSLGPVNAHTAMWLRDAALHDKLPTLEQLDDPRFFPYRYGHALWSYLALRFGDDIVGRVLRTRGRAVVTRLEQITGLDRGALARDWHASIRIGTAAPAAGIVPGRTVLRARDRLTRLFVAPAISPDGSQVMFLSERDRLSLDLYLADAGSGNVTKKIVGTAADPHFDSLQYIHSSGDWDPSGRRFAFAALGSGQPVLTVVDVQSGARDEHALPSLGEIYNPSWSPDGARLVFSALKGGLSDLFVFTIGTKSLERLTSDAFADLHPAWSPDGRSIAFATDRFTTTVETLDFGSLRIGVLELSTGRVEPLVPEPSRAKQINPQWTPDSAQVYFVSDRDGVSNIYRVRRSDGTIHQVTAVRGGVTGITATSPSIAVASRSGTLAYSVYRNGRYEIRALDAESAMAGSPVEPSVAFTSAGTLAAATNSAVSQALIDSVTGLPGVISLEPAQYDARLRLESITQPYVGASTGNTFGGALRASVGFSFGDILKDRQLHTLFRLGTDIDDFAGQIAYMNRRRRLNWGVTTGFMPSRFYGTHRSVERDGALVTRETTSLRYTHQWATVNARYSLNRSQRVEFGAGVRRTGFEWQTYTRVLDSVAQDVVSREARETPGGQPIHLAEAHAAFVHDTAVFGSTSPILGQRYRFEVEPAFGGLQFADVRLDYRRYIMPLRPFTIAVRVEHVGRYGPGAKDPRLTPLVYGLQTLVRGYDLRSFAADECGAAATTCSMMDELTGSRFALVNIELRAPLFGLLSRSLDYGRFPIEALAFVDAGFLWTGARGRALEYDRFRSVGAGARVNVGGIIMEMTAARPFDRARSGWRASFLLRPGF
jgi:Tol biopolymer transport system component